MAWYLYGNAALYLVFALWMTLNPAGTASALGLQALAGSGRSEFLVVYGGLQLGLAVFFAWTAYATDSQRVGVIFALCLYALIVLYRAVTVWRFWPVGSTTLVVGALELSLLLIAAVLFAIYCAGRNP